MYLVRKHLGFEVSAWEALPWHWQRAYLDELATDGLLSGGGSDGAPDLSDLAEHGVTVRRR